MPAVVRMMNKLVHVGIAEGDNPDRARRVWLTNGTGLLAAVTSVAFVPLHLAVGAPARALLLLVAVALFASALLFSWARSPTLSRVILVFGVNINVLLMQATDAQAHMWVCFVPIACAAMLVFTHEERLAGWSGAAISIVLVILTLAGGLDPVSAALDQPPIPAWIDWAVVCLALMMTPTIIALLNRQVARHDREQARARDALEAEVSRGQAIAAQLAAATESAETASQAKSAFLANMSHEIRTPLAAVVTLTDLARKAETAERSEEYLRLVSGSAGHLLQILNDILDLSKVEAGRLVLERTSMDLGALVDDVVGLARVRADEKAIRVLVEVSVGSTPWRLADPLRLKQILMNLIGNALKFTDHGSVTLTVRASGDRVRFEVQDTGIGMSEDQIERVFEPFHQAEHSTSRRFGGTGLGLTICRRILDLWGSELQVASTLGEGSRLWFTLDMPPATRVVADVSYARSAQPSEPLRVLVAEDNPVNQLIARRLLEQRGHSVHVVEDGLEAVDAAFDGFDAILMDLQMPNLDGREATRRIRAIEADKGLAPLPIVALTANAMSGEERLCLDAGMDEYLTKPVEPELLELVLGALVQRRSA